MNSFTDKKFSQKFFILEINSVDTTQYEINYSVTNKKIL